MVLSEMELPPLACKMVGGVRGRNEQVERSRCPLKEEFLPHSRVKSVSQHSQGHRDVKKNFVSRPFHIILRNVTTIL